jgi:hypothetical protein
LSLKSFHLFFIAVAALCSLGFGVWGFFEHQRTGAPVAIAYAAGGMVGAGLLIAYGLRALRKLQGSDAP